MLASIPGWKLIEWQTFDQLEPDLDKVIDWNLAHVVQALLRNGKPLSDFRLALGDAAQLVSVAPQQTIAQQERLIDSWIIGSNAIYAARNKGR